MKSVNSVSGATQFLLSIDSSTPSVVVQTRNDLEAIAPRRRERLGDPNRGLWTGFTRSAEKFAERPAVIAEGRRVSYGRLREIARRIAATIQAYPEFCDPHLTAVFAYRSPSAFAGVLGALLAGNGYVPLNRTFPADRTRGIFERSGCRAIIVDTQSSPSLDVLLHAAKEPLLVLLPDLEDVEAYRERWPRHIFVGFRELKPEAAWREPAISADAIAYLMFTSGSTGTPKGVVVQQRNVISFLDFTVERFHVTEQDVLSQMFDMTFDLSVSDMFVAWEQGACICCPSQKTLLNPDKFIQDNGLTIWFSVPSTAALMRQMGLLRPGRYPSLRVSLFCGEPLPVSLARAWREAAPNSILENLYGPTELTIACTLYRWDPVRSPEAAELGIVPIGYPYPGMDALVVDETLIEVGPGEAGELLMTGPQMSLGYWKDPEKTASAFVIPPGRQEVFYRTGDRVRRPTGDGPLTHLGRVDFQIKVRGYRVELGEIEAVAREISGMDGVVAVGWPVTPSGFAGVELFIEGEIGDVDTVREAIARRLPDYMVPRRVHFLRRLPRTMNGKFDRSAITRILGEGI